MQLVHSDLPHDTTLDQQAEMAVLAKEIELCGFYPDLVLDSVRVALGNQPLLDHLVHHEATFINSEIHRHLTVLALTPTRLLVGHTDENPLDQGVQAVSSVESVSLDKIYSVVLTRVVQDPERFASGGAALFETWLSLAWGALRRVEMEPATCADPDCAGDHGYSGSSAAEDLTIRMSEAADGAQNTAKLVAFSAGLQSAVGAAK